MKYAVIAALCASAVSAACADPTIINVESFTKEGCAAADKKTMDKATTDTMVKAWNIVLKAAATCTKNSKFGNGIKAIKGDDCANDGYGYIAYTDEACKTEADLTSDQKK